MREFPLNVQNTGRGRRNREKKKKGEGELLRINKTVQGQLVGELHSNYTPVRLKKTALTFIKLHPQTLGGVWAAFVDSSAPSLLYSLGWVSRDITRHITRLKTLFKTPPLPPTLKDPN